jgi:putative DNA primase/helicase
VNGQGSNGHSVDVVAEMARRKGVSAESLKRFGATAARRGRVNVCRLPMYDADMQKVGDFDMAPGELEKGKMTSGSKHGLFVVERPKLGATIAVVEGPKDAAALDALGIPAIGLPTCQMSAKFARLFRGCHVVLIPDRDKAGMDGAEQTASRLFGVAVNVKIAELPAEYRENGGADVRDVLRMKDGESLLRSAIASAREWAPGTNTSGTVTGSEVQDPGRVKILTEAICLHDYFAQDAGGKLYVYRGGVFCPRAEQHIRGRVKALLTDWQQTKAWSTRLVSEVVEFIRVDAPELPSRPRMDLVNVENGMLRVVDGVLLPHDPKYLSVVQLPITYDPAATCPNIDAFVVATFPDDAHDLASQVPGVFMLPITWLQKAILLLGEGCNGKSVWLSLLTRFLGRQNVSALPLHKLESDKFSVARLVGKLANICADLPSEHLAGTSTFKALVGGDVLTAEYKFRDSFDVEPFARLVFSANHPPRSADSSAAFFRRWVVIPFDRTFTQDEQIPRDVLDSQLQAPAELSGLLNRALDGLRRVQQQRGFSEPASIQAAWRDFHATTDPLAVWLDRNTVDDPDAFVACKSLRVAYNAAAEREGRPSMTEHAFGRTIRKQRPNVESKQRTVGGRLQWCYIGLGLTADDSHASRDSHLNPSLFLSHGNQG